MATHLQIYYQIVFSTYKRERTLIKEHRPELFKYIWGVIKNHDCHLYRINGVDDHLHILTDLHPSQKLADLVKDIKLSATDMIKRNSIFPNFGGWQDGYGAFTYNRRDKEMMINYIKSQEEHHQTKSYRDEYIELLKENDVIFEEKYLL